MQYPKLGSTVTYIRVDGSSAVSGSGLVKAISLSPDDRVMVLVDGHNVDLATINATPENAQAYATLIDEVDRISTEGNAKIKELVEQYNGMVAALYADFDQAQDREKTK